MGNVFLELEDMQQAQLAPDKEDRMDKLPSPLEEVVLEVEEELEGLALVLVEVEEEVSWKEPHNPNHQPMFSYKLTSFSPLYIKIINWFKPSNQRELLLHLLCRSRGETI